jgi:enamine deaminase RidA (YjgF/YER057c/UK114 family)
MSTRLLSPAGMLQGAPYHHVAVATGTTQVHVAGQVGQRGNDPVAADDLATQVAECLRNAALGLSAAGATFADVVRLTFYVARWTPDHIEPFMEGVRRVADEIGLQLPLPPSSLIGVEVLYAPDVLVEVEATAVLP